MSTNNRFMKNMKGNSSSSSSMMSSSMIIFVIIAILILIYLYVTIRGYNNFVNNSPMIIRDTVDGTKPMKIEGYKIANPSDGKYGTEFSYSFWVYLKDSNFGGSADNTDCDSDDDVNIKTTILNYKHLFHKGSNDMYIGSGSSKYRNLPLLQSPGVWLYPNENKLNIRFNTYNNESTSVYETCDVGNIPINKWVHISIILIGNSVDVYVNCNLKKRQKLSGIPKLNDGDLYINQFGGFNGYLSRFRYYNYAIDPFELDLICKMGPSDSVPMDDLSLKTGSGSGGIGSYLSPDYWFNYGFPVSAGYPNTIQNAPVTSATVVGTGSNVGVSATVTKK